MDNRSSMRHMSCFNGLTGGLRDDVLNIGTSHLGHCMAVLNLNGNKLDLGVVNTVLCGNLTTSMLHCGLDRVGNCMSNRCNMMGNRESNMVSNWSCNMVGNTNRSRERGMSNISTIVGICLSVSLCFPLVKTMVSMRSITDGIDHLLAKLLVLNLLGVHSLCGAHILC